MRHRELLGPGRKHGVLALVAHEGIEIAEYAVGSYTLGYVQRMHPERAVTFGIPTDLLVGIVGKAASLGCELLDHKYTAMAAPHFNNAGNIGLAAFFHTMGSGHGAKASGTKMLRLPVGADAEKAKAMIPGSTVIGDIGPAPYGALLSRKSLANLAK